MNLVLLLVSLLVVSWLASRLYRNQAPDLKPYFLPSLGFKIASGMAVGILYFYHYGAGDTISYWQDGVKISEFMKTAPGDAIALFWDETGNHDFVNSLAQKAPRSLFFSKICGLIAFAAGDNYWAMAGIFSFVSFLGAWFLFRRVVTHFPNHKKAAAIAFLFFPSVVFWSSGIIKESLGLAALYFLLALCISFLFGRNPSWKEWILALISLWIGWNLKYYWLGIFLPVAFTTLMVAILKRSKATIARWELTVWTGLFIVFLFVGTSIHPNFYPSRFLEVIVQSNLEFNRLSEPPRIVQYLNLEPSVASLVKNAPAGLIAGLFRPFLWEAYNPLSVMAGLENLILLLMVLIALPAIRKLGSGYLRMPALAALVYVVLLAGFLALSTPNFGTLSRYKIGVVPVLVFLCLCGSTTLNRWLGDKRN